MQKLSISRIHTIRKYTTDFYPTLAAYPVCRQKSDPVKTEESIHS